MKHVTKTVTVYCKKYDEENAFDVYHGTVIKGVSFFGRVATNVSTDGTSTACEATLRIPLEAVPDNLMLKNGDLVCEGTLQTEGMRPAELAELCDYVFTVVGVSRNTSGRSPHIKAVCK